MPFEQLIRLCKMAVKARYEHAKEKNLPVVLLACRIVIVDKPMFALKHMASLLQNNPKFCPQYMGHLSISGQI